MGLSLAPLAIQASSVDCSSRVGTAVLKKTLDSVELTGESMIKMMEQSVQPSLGQNIDLKV